MRILIGMLFLVGLTGCASTTSSKLIGAPAPYTRVTLLDGDVVALPQISSGKSTVVAFWASTCTYSPRAIEKLNKFATVLKPRGVEFVAISIDKAEAFNDIKGMIQYREMNHFQHAFSGNDIRDEAYIAFDGDQLPLIVVIDENGTVVAAGHKPAVVEEYFQLS